MAKPARRPAGHAYHEALASAAAPVAAEAVPVTKHEGAVSVRRSLADPNKIISMIDGKPYSSLTRHLSSRGLTPAEYRERYGLKHDYPMVAPGYSVQRREVASKIGMGRKAGHVIAAAAEAVIEKVADAVAPKRKTLKARFARTDDGASDQAGTAEAS